MSIHSKLKFIRPVFPTKPLETDHAKKHSWRTPSVPEVHGRHYIGQIWAQQDGD